MSNTYLLLLIIAFIALASAQLTLPVEPTVITTDGNVVTVPPSLRTFTFPSGDDSSVTTTPDGTERTPTSSTATSTSTSSPISVTTSPTIVTSSPTDPAPSSSGTTTQDTTAAGEAADPTTTPDAAAAMHTIAIGILAVGLAAVL